MSYSCNYILLFKKFIHSLLTPSSDMRKGVSDFQLTCLINLRMVRWGKCFLQMSWAWLAHSSNYILLFKKTIQPEFSDMSRVNWNVVRWINVCLEHDWTINCIDIVVANTVQCKLYLLLFTKSIHPSSAISRGVNAAIFIIKLHQWSESNVYMKWPLTAIQKLIVQGMCWCNKDFSIQFINI